MGKSKHPEHDRTEHGCDRNSSDDGLHFLKIRHLGPGYSD